MKSRPLPACRVHRGSRVQRTKRARTGGRSDGCPHRLASAQRQVAAELQPEDVVQHCLTLFRKADAPALAPFLPPAAAVAATSGDIAYRRRVGGAEVVEQGRLACLSVLDIGAGRVLPGHLLRRSRVLSSLRLAADEFQQRIALTACSGEEATFTWQLRRRPQPREHGSGGAAAAGSSGRVDSSIGSAANEDGWFIESVERDLSSDDPLPTTPHPKASPEAVVKAQLAALQQGDIFQASCFNSWSSPLEGTPAPGGRRGFSMGLHFVRLRDMLADPPYAALLRPTAAWLGSAALPTQRTMLQEVWVEADPVSAGTAEALLPGAGLATVCFVWRLGMQANGCWMTTAIAPVVRDGSSE